jgi:hypothetical protein
VVSVLLPEAVAPTSATVRPGSTVKSTSVEQRLLGVVGVAEVLDLERAPRVPAGSARSP